MIDKENYIQNGSNLKTTDSQKWLSFSTCDKKHPAQSEAFNSFYLTHLCLLVSGLDDFQKELKTYEKL